MKMIYSLTCQDNKVWHGYNNEKEFYYFLALSMLSNRKYFKNSEFIGDARAIESIERLKLPFDTIVEIERVSTFPSGYWAHSKILAYQLQKEPFIHVDNDLILFKAPDLEAMKGDLIAQNVEPLRHFTGYDIIKRMIKKVDPSTAKKYSHVAAQNAYNTGFFGGNNIDAIQEYCRVAMEFFAELSKKKYVKLHSHWGANLVGEQYILPVVACRLGLKIDTIYDPFLYMEDSNDKIDAYYKPFFDSKARKAIGFSHYLSSYKKRSENVEIIKKMLKAKFPVNYNTIDRLML